jgi:putative inorganic carbon (HCO3(-)) transporter
MSASAPLSVAWPPTGRRELMRSFPAGVPLAAAALLGAAIASRSPVLIGLALAAVALAVIVRPERALVVFAAGFYLNLPVLVAHGFHLSSALASAFALLLLSPFLIYVVAERRPLVITSALAGMIGYLVVLVLSATLVGGARSSAVGPTITFLSEGLLLYVLVSNAVRTTHLLRAVVWTVILAGAFMGLVSVWQELTHSYHQALGGLAQVDVTGFDVGTGISGNGLRPRLAGPIGEKNRYAQVLLVLLPLALSRLRAERRGSMRLLAGACAALILAGVVLSFSRGAGVALLIVLLAAGALRMISLRQTLAILAVVVGLAAVIAPDYIVRLQSLGGADTALSQSSGVDGAIQGRATENIAALHVFRDHPVLGVGPGQFFNRYSAQYGNALDLRFLEQNRRAHNLYLEIAADTGLLGLAAFVGIVAVTMAQLRRLSVLCRARAPELASLGQALLLALIAYMASGAFLQLAYQRYFWFLMALANAAVWLLRREAGRVPQRTPLCAL